MDLNVIITEQLRKNAEKNFDRIREAYRNGVDTLDEYKENKRMVQEEKRDAGKAACRHKTSRTYY